MDFIKTRRGRLIIIGVVLAAAVLCGLGILRGKHLPEISLAAEHIPVTEHFNIPNTLPATWLTMLILIGVGWSYKRAVDSGGPPSRFQMAVEAIAEGMLGFMEDAVGEKARVFFPLVATFFFFITISNWCGILPGFGSIGVWVEHHGEEVLVPFFRSANAHLSTTLALALVSVVAAQYFGLRMQGTSYLNKYFNFKASSPKPDPDEKGLEATISKVAWRVEAVINGIVGLLEIILEALKVLPFSFRLFGNIFAGEVLLFVVSFLFAFVFPIVFFGLEIFVGLIQGLIFAMLTLVFFSIATTSHHGEESH